MNEQIRIRLTANGAPLPITMTRDGAVLRGESGAAPRRVRLGLQPSGAPTRKRVEFVQQREGWPGTRFDLNVTGMTDGIAVSGVKPNTLPPGIYDGRLSVDDLRFSNRGSFHVEVLEHGAPTPFSTRPRTRARSGCRARCSRFQTPCAGYSSHPHRRSMAWRWTGGSTR